MEIHYLSRGNLETGVESIKEVTEFFNMIYSITVTVVQSAIVKQPLASKAGLLCWNILNDRLIELVSPRLFCHSN